MSRGDARVRRQCRPAPSHLVLVIFLSLSTSRTWLSVLAELAHRAVPTLAPTIVGRDSVRGRPAERKPQEVVRTTSLASMQEEDSPQQRAQSMQVPDVSNQYDRRQSRVGSVNTDKENDEISSMIRKMMEQEKKEKGEQDGKVA